ncbi:hypothetical protein ACQBAU_17355 [Propionibacteriaceae bacterium Y2011]
MGTPTASPGKSAGTASSAWYVGSSKPAPCTPPSDCRLPLVQPAAAAATTPIPPPSSARLDTIGELDSAMVSSFAIPATLVVTPEPDPSLNTVGAA